MLKISELKEGEAATILAEVIRCYSFKSKRNSNLSVIELNLRDSTGRIRITRFITGRRFNNYSYLQSQVRNYPPGATVAVSGMVKNGPQGNTFKDPLIEVIEKKNSTIKSKSIGRILSIYSLYKVNYSENIFKRKY